MYEFQQECGLSIVRDLVSGEQNISRIYGFILYSQKDPYVAKVLRDSDFWNALDGISGNNWPIFAVRPLQQGSLQLKGGGNNHLGFMVQVWEEPNDNLAILQDFGLTDSQDLPLFIAFMWDDEDNLNEMSIEIKGTDVDSVYHSIREIVETITRVENDIDPEYKRTVNVFRNVKSAIESLKYKHKVISIGKILYKLVEFFSMLP